jgi:hypothetical protein
MMERHRAVSAEESAAILRLHHAEEWPVGTIAAQLGRHHDTVERVLAQSGLPVTKPSARARLVDPYLPFIQETLAKHPRLRASRLWSMVKKRGYTGSKSAFRAIISRLRPRPHAEAYVRRAVLAGQEGQVDWAYFGKLTVGRAQRDLWAFVMVLAYSRLRFLRFGLRAAMPSFLRGHVESFRFFNAVPRVILYDYVARHVIVVLWPAPLRGHDAADATSAGGGSLAGPHNGQSPASQARSASSFRQTAFRGGAAEAVTGGSQVAKAASFARMLISA